LSVLHDAGFLKLRKDGLWSLYSIDETDMDEYLIGLVESVRKALVGNKLAALDRERLKKAERVGPGCAGRSTASIK
jgi:ArsR family transcriptional regulator